MMEISKKLAWAICLVLFFQYTEAQEFRINSYAGYVFKDKIDSYNSSSSYFRGTIQDGFRWGLGAEYSMGWRGALELQYLRQDTNAPTTYQDGSSFNGQIQDTNFDVGINWIMANGTKYFPVNGVLEPFTGLGIGMGIFKVNNPDNGNSSSATKFAWQMRAGSNFWISDHVALRAQISLISATQAVGGGLYFSSGGVGTSLNSYSSLYQIGLGGGIVFKIPQN